jgi:hypothetical protein
VLLLTGAIDEVLLAEPLVILHGVEVQLRSNLPLAFPS